VVSKIQSTRRMQKFRMLNRRNNQTEGNDGLPIIRGEKLKNRRQKLGGKSNDGPDDKSNDSFRYLFYTVLVILLFVEIRDRRKVTAVPGAPVQAKVSEVVAQAKVSEDVGQAEVSEISGKTEVSNASTQTEVETREDPGGGYGFPDICTSAQLTVLKKQLPTDKLIHRYWRDASFTIATKRSDFTYNPILMRQFYASDRFHLSNSDGFYGVLVNVIDNEVPLDTLAIGSRDKTLDPTKWREERDGEGKLPFEPVEISGASNPARVLVIDWEESSKPAKSLRDLKKSLGISDDLLALTTIEKKHISEENVFMNTVRDNAPKVNDSSSSNQPIHFLDIMCGHGCFSEILYSLQPMWKDVRYVHFEYDHGHDEFRKPKMLSNVISDLKAAGLVCYFAGKKEIDYGLWRITDCFQDHYDHPHWSEIACVNVMQDEVKILASEMEKKFHETLTKDHEFPAMK